MTGAASGIGEATAARFREEGATVASLDVQGEVEHRVDELPVPNSTRPSEMRSRTATDSAVRMGWLYGFGSRRTP